MQPRRAVNGASRAVLRAATYDAAAIAQNNAAASASGAVYRKKSVAFDVQLAPEGPGRNYDLNWSLCASSVFPQNSAWRNVRTADAVRMAKAETSVEVKASKSKLLQAGKQAVNGVASVSQSEFDNAKGKVTNALSNTSNVVVFDGALGTDRNAEVRTRVISDSSSAALLAQNLIPRTRLTGSAVSFKPSVTVYMPTQQVAGVPAGQVFVDVSAGVIVSGGVPDLNTLQAALSLCAANSTAAMGAVTCAGSYNPSTQQLLFGQADSSAASQGAHTFSFDGVSRLFVNDPSANGTGEYGDVVMVSGSSKTVVRNGSRLFANVLPVKSVGIVVNDKSKTIPAASVATPEQAAFFLLAQQLAHVPSPTDAGMNLISLLSSTGASSFIVNPAQSSMAESLKGVSKAKALSLSTKDNKDLMSARASVEKLCNGNEDIMKGAPQ